MTTSNWITIGVTIMTVGTGLSIQAVIFVFWFGRFSQKMEGLQQEIEELSKTVRNGLSTKIGELHDSMFGIKERVGILESHTPIPGSLHYPQNHRSK